MKRFIRNQSFARFSRFSVPQYKPEQNDQKFRNWNARLNSIASKPVTKVYLSQLGALMNYYNKQISDTTSPIDWNTWQGKITTKGLVEKVKTSFNQLNQKQYDLDRIFTDIFSRDSKALDEINNQMAFHTAVWLDNYFDYVQFLSDLDSVSCMTDYSTLQYLDMHPGTAAQGDALTQTHNYFAGAKDDINLFMYMGVQFNWGKKVFTFYRHPADDNKSGRATKNTMGR